MAAHNPGDVTGKDQRRGHIDPSEQIDIGRCYFIQRLPADYRPGMDKGIDPAQTRPHGPDHVLDRSGVGQIAGNDDGSAASIKARPRGFEPRTRKIRQGKVGAKCGKLTCHRRTNATGRARHEYSAASEVNGRHYHYCNAG
jgi:hypothetical protein